MSITSPLMQPSPHTPEGRHPHCHFRGLLRLYSRYGPPNRSAALRRPLSRGSDPSGCPREPLVSYRTNRKLSGWNLPPLMVRAFGAHGVIRTSASDCSTLAGFYAHSIINGQARREALAFHNFRLSPLAPDLTVIVVMATATTCSRLCWLGG